MVRHFCCTLDAHWRKWSNVQFFCGRLLCRDYHKRLPRARYGSTTSKSILEFSCDREAEHSSEAGLVRSRMSHERRQPMKCVRTRHEWCFNELRISRKTLKTGTTLAAPYFRSLWTRNIQGQMCNPCRSMALSYHIDYFPLHLWQTPSGADYKRLV